MPQPGIECDRVHLVLSSWFVGRAAAATGAFQAPPDAPVSLSFKCIRPQSAAPHNRDPWALALPARLCAAWRRMPVRPWAGAGQGKRSHTRPARTGHSGVGLRWMLCLPSRPWRRSIEIGVPFIWR